MSETQGTTRNKSEPPARQEDASSLNTVPAQECDLIMKGGVTSGVVYPPAILKLAREYRFRSIGGASAGAIAAAAAAAAEYGRNAKPEELRTSTAYGFERLAEMNDELRKPGFVRDLFQPSDEGRPLLQTFLEWRSRTAEAEQEEALAKARGEPPPGKWGRALRMVMRATSVFESAVEHAQGKGAALGLVIAAVLASGIGAWGVAWLWTPDWKLRVLGVLVLGVALGLCWVGGTLGGLIGGGWGLWRTVQHLEDKGANKYGICHGSAGYEARLDAEKLALVDWLHVRFNQLAGRRPEDPPLTLCELRCKGIDFKLVTTNLTLGQPYILPMSRGSRSFFFKRSELEKLFPRPVVEALAKWGTANRPTEPIRLTDTDAKEFLRFPMGEDMPLVVATRLSLSFPVLLSAVRLYSVKTEKYIRRAGEPPQLIDVNTDVEEHWLSDGGITSNFPIHVFDAWVPRRPTFGITLYDSPIPRVLDQREEAKTSRPVVLPKPKDFDKARPQRTAIDGLADFLRAVFETAQSYRDNAQAGLPSYRERIAQVFLEKKEGGLNLDMPKEVIDGIQEKGRDAAAELLERYPSTHSPHFSEHRWVRLQVLMSELERQLLGVRGLFDKDDTTWKAQLKSRFEALFQEQLAAQARKDTEWYRKKNEAWCKEARERMDALLTLIESWDKAQKAWQETHQVPGHEPPPFFFADQPPRPQGVLKITPDL